MQHTCANPFCRQPFRIAPDDLAFYDAVSPVFQGKKELIPPPTKCPDCRLQQRAMLRNERTLRRGTCASCGERTLSMYAPDSPFTAYCHACWWSDSWDALSFGKDIDNGNSFFAQFQELLLAVPRMAVLNPVNENSDFCNCADWNKNCYMVINSNSNEDSFYSTLLLDSKSSMDCLWTKDSELCYECVNVEKSYNVRFSLDCADCRDSLFLTDCRGCTQCIGCVNLRQKTLCIFNEPVTQQVFREKLRELQSSGGIERFRKEYADFLATKPRIALHVQQSEGSSGEHIVRCKNVRESFDIFDSQDCAYCDTVMIIKDCLDCHCTVKAELCIENTSLIGYHAGFTAFCRHPRDTWYSWDCHNVSNVFGCVGLRQKEYCILNRQYTKEEYEALVPKLIDHMRTSREWGEYFPAALSPFAYNETVAQEYFPLTKDVVQERGWRWSDERSPAPDVQTVIAARDLLDTIDTTPGDILGSAISCEATGRPFRIIKQELEFYRKMQLPIPHLHPDERHSRRLALRTSRKMWERDCASCGKRIWTSYGPERPERVLCEECYLREVY